MQVFSTSLRSRLARLGLCALVVLLGLTAAAPSAFAQTSTATVRGHVQDSTGAVLPGATITLTNQGTKAMTTAVTDDHGQYLLSVFPGAYDLKVELSGFKTFEQKNVALAPSDARGLDVKLEVGQQSETITVTAQAEIIQTETGAREGVLSAKQIDNLSVIGRSSLELLRILPGVVTDFNQGESVSFGGGANNTQGYTVNGIRSSGNTVSLDGSSLIDVGSNSGVIVTLNNDMVSGSEGPELELRGRVRRRRHERQRRHQGRQLAVPRRGLRLHPRQPSSPRTTAPTASPARRSRRASINTRAATSAVRSSSATTTPRTATSCSSSSAFEGSASRSIRARASSRTLRRRDAQRRLQRAAGQPRLEPEQRPAAADSAGLPRRGPAGAEQQHGALHDADRASTSRACIRRRTTPIPTISTTTSTAALEPPNRLDFKTRFDWNISNRTKAYVRDRARVAKTSRIRAVCGGAPRTWRCRRRTSARTSAARSPATSCRC